MENTKKVSFSTFLEDLAYVTQKILGTNDRIPAKDIPKLLYEYYDSLSDEDKSQIISVINTAVVPAGTYIDTVYINKAISPDEVIESISKLNFIKDLYKPGYYGYRITAATAGPVGIHVLTKNPDDVSKGMLIVMTEMISSGVYQDVILFSTNAELSYEYNGALTVGWNNDASDTLEIKHNVYNGNIVDNFTNELLNVTSHMNGLLCKIFSVIPYEKTSLNFESGEYYNSEVFITKNGEYNLADFIKDKVIPSKITANVAATLSEIEVTPTNETQIIEAEDVDGFNKIKVNPIPDEYLIPELQEKSVTPSSESQEILPDEEYDGLSKVTVNPIPNEYMKTADATATVNDIRIGKTAYISTGKVEGTIEDYDGAYEGNGEKVRELNIHYSLDEPTDTKQLWVKKDFNLNKLIASNEMDFVNVLNDDVLGISIDSGYRNTLQVVDNVIYSFGRLSKGAGYNSVAWYDLETREHSREYLLPNNTYAMSSGAIGKKIYLFGGKDYSNIYYDTILEFDTETKTIRTLDIVLPYKIADMSSCTVGTKIYLFGGTYKNEEGTEIISNEIYIFDSKTETLDKLNAVLPNEITGGKSILVDNNKIFIVCCKTSSGDYSNIFIFNIENNTAEKIEVNFPTNFTYVFTESAAIYKNIIYIFWNTSIYMFDIVSNTITTSNIKLKQSVTSSSTIAVGKYIYIWGGYYGSGTNYGKFRNELQKFTPILDVIKNHLLLQTDTNNLFKLLNNDSYDIEIGVKDAYVGNENNEGEQVKIALHNGTSWVNIN